MRKVSSFFSVLALLVLAIGCEDESSCEGQYGCACRADATCDPGLFCAEGVVCVPDSPPDPTADASANAGSEPPPQDSGQDSGSTTAPPSETDTLPAICQPVFQQWDTQCESWEDQLIQAINERRAESQECGAQGAQPPVPALEKNLSLQCAARLNAKEAIDVGDLSVHSEQQTSTATERAQAAGYGEGKVAENLLGNRTTPSRVLDTWMEYESHCLNIMNAEFTEIGVGCYQIPDANIATVDLFVVWTAQFGGPIVGWSPED